jgi:CobQ-like glutamine amidotransferase family enzyme
LKFETKLFHSVLWLAQKGTVIKMLFRIAHLYPHLLNLYGDQGNPAALKKRLEWRGHTAEVDPVGLNAQVDWDAVDMVFMGGGSDREQNLILDDLHRHTDALRARIEDGLPALLICGAYQLIGRAYRHESYAMDGLNWFGFETVGGKKRLVGNVVVECELDGVLKNVVGFENHAGQTYFDPGSGLKAWGKVVKGYGNNGADGEEGLRYKNLIGTYLHGPLLPKNPLAADFFIRRMLERKGVFTPLAELDDRIEDYAREQLYHRLMS